jgi:hypothetical protein
MSILPVQFYVQVIGDNHKNVNLEKNTVTESLNTDI